MHTRTHTTLRRLLSSAVLAISFALMGCGNGGGTAPHAESTEDFPQFAKDLVRTTPAPGDAPVNINGRDFIGANPQGTNPYDELFD